MTPALQHRTAGILAHITSLPSPYGIGDIGLSATIFLQFLASAGQSCWQFLPINPTLPFFDNSPYMSTSAFAGSPLIISPEWLYQEGRITQRALEEHPQFSPYQVDFQAVTTYKTAILQQAFSIFRPEQEPDYADFLSKQRWVSSYALFMALKKSHPDTGWQHWPENLAHREPEALRQAEQKLASQIRYYLFEQYIFWRQWQRLHTLAKEMHIALIGDIPIYVGMDSVDVWENPSIFTLRPKTLQPSHVSGVPPDYFSATGQRWGNPLYRWNSRNPDVQKSLREWWLQRIALTFERVDISRIDHFRGFADYWSIPAENTDAIKGTWIKGPGRVFFDEIACKLGALPIIAEDLGIITEDVIKLRDSFGFPGMKILQFAFDGQPDNAFLPCNYGSANFVVYTGTHDNATTLGWYLAGSLDDASRQFIKQTANRDLHDTSSIHRDLIYLAYSSIAQMAVIPLQDVLGFGDDCRMNTPSVASGNWRWRCAPDFLTAEIADYLAQLAARFNRKRHIVKPAAGQANQVQPSIC